MDELLKIFLPIYSLAFIFIVFIARIYIVSRQNGKSAYVLFNQDGVHGIIGFYFKVLPLFSLCAVVVYSFFPAHYDYLGPISLFELDSLAVIGVSLLLLSLIWVWVAQSNMGNSWRIGIDTDEKTELRMTGLFTLSRNPIYLGMKLNVIGFFLTIPNALTLTVLVTVIALIDIQVELEEEYLQKMHGEDYLNYQKKVRRWI